MESSEKLGPDGILTLHCKVVAGLKAASGYRENENPNLTGTISKQRKFFVSAGVKRAESWHAGTINLDISPKEFEILKSDYTVTAEWSPGTVETFWLVNITLEHKERTYPAYIYYPCQSDVKAHPDTLIEIVAEKIEDLNYGDLVTIKIPNQQVIVKD